MKYILEDDEKVVCHVKPSNKHISRTRMYLQLKTNISSTLEPYVFGRLSTAQAVQKQWQEVGDNFRISEVK